MKQEVSAGAIVYKIDKGIKFLFLISPKMNLDIPKGHIEKGESSIEAAKREIKEETGLEVDFIPYFEYKNKYFFSENGERILKRVNVYLANVSKNANVMVSEEHIGYEWLSYSKAMNKVKYRDMKALLKKAYDYIKRYEKMKKLNARYKSVSNRKSFSLSRRFVPGEGPLNANIMLIGQAPGDTEDKMLRPFVGRSGRLLDEILAHAKIKRDSVYITSVVQFYPPKNRLPTQEEVRLCEPFLKKQIEIVKPKFIILLGNLAVQTVLGIEGVEKLHGKVVRKNSMTYLATYHPAAALRFPRTKREMLKDFEKFKRIVG